MGYSTLKLLTEQEEGYGLISEWNTRNGCSGELSNDIQDMDVIKKILSESDEKLTKDHHSIFMNCILQKCDTENRNGRFYPREILVREDKNYQQLIGEGRATGEANHPDSSNIDVKNLSHRVIKSWWEGNTLLGVLEILTSKIYHINGTICCTGDIIADLLRRGVKMGISSRGVGSLKNIHGRNTVQSDFELICYDLVASPSTPGAFLYPESEVNLNESVEKTDIKISKNLLSLVMALIERCPSA